MNKMIIKILKFIYHIFIFIILKIKYYFICILNKKIQINLDNYRYLFFNNNQKGGTRKYVNDFLEKKDNILVVEIISYVWPICYCIYDKYNNKKYINLKTIEDIFEYNYNIIYVNSLAFYRNIFKIQKMIVDYKNKNDVEIQYMLHDYHAVCPRLNLIKNDYYCNLECDGSCDLEITYGGLKNVSIKKWRNNWSDFFKVVDKILCFSESSKKILLEAYDQIEKKIEVIPHKYNDKLFNKISTVNDDNCVIGIVGTINNVAKGINQCKYIIDNLDNNIQIVFIGTEKKEININKKNVNYLGRYNKDDLEKAIINYKINKFIFPSICPETFSFVISELIMFDLPIYAFGIGAQGERVNNYSKGKVFNNVNEMVNYINNQERIRKNKKYE